MNRSERTTKGPPCAAAWVVLVLLLFCVLAPWTALAQPAAASSKGATTDTTRSAVPQPRTEYMGRRIAQTMHFNGAPWLIRKTREREENASRMRQELRLKPGMVVCDLGCGNGYHTLPMAKAVGPHGRVFAVDIQPQMLYMLRQNLEAQRIANVTPILGSTYDPRLPDRSVDLVLLVDVYHEFAYPERMLRAIHRALKPDGVVVLAEYRAEDPKVPIKPLHKMSKAQVNKELTANGFRLVREFDGLPWQHLMFFGKAPAAAEPTAPKPEDKSPPPK